MTQLWQLSAAKLANAYHRKQASPVEATAAIIARCQSHAEPLNAISHQLYEQALEAAKESEKRYMKGRPLSTLDGVPCTIKENVATQGHNNTMGSVIFRNAPIATVSAPSAARLLDAGAILFAKTTMTDFGLAGSGASTLHGACKNPYNTHLNTNGSSSGSAVALAVGAGPISIGTDLCGSIRNPAAWCGVVGFKQNYGIIPHTPATWGRHAGPMTRSVADAQTMYNILRGPHTADASALPLLAPGTLPNSLEGLKVGLILNAYGMPAVEPAIANAVQQAALHLQAAGAQVIDLSDQPVWHQSMRCWHYYLGLTGAFAMHRIDQEQHAKLPPSTLDFNYISGPSTSLHAGQALADLSDARQAMHQASLQVDVLLSPTIPTSPFAAELYGIDNDPTRHIEHLNYTGIFNLSGQPAISIPGGMDDAGMPIGIQLASNLYEDNKLLWIARQLETYLAFEYRQLEV